MVCVRVVERRNNGVKCASWAVNGAQSSYWSKLVSLEIQSVCGANHGARGNAAFTEHNMENNLYIISEALFK